MSNLYPCQNSRRRRRHPRPHSVNVLELILLYHTSLWSMLVTVMRKAAFLAEQSVIREASPVVCSVWTQMVSVCRLRRILALWLAMVNSLKERKDTWSHPVMKTLCPKQGLESPIAVGMAFLQGMVNPWAKDSSIQTILVQEIMGHHTFSQMKMCSSWCTNQDWKSRCWSVLHY